MVYLLGGFTSKVHHIREAQLAAEPPEYYSSPKLLSFSVHVPRVPADFNGWPNAQHSHEEMIQKHLRWAARAGGAAVPSWESVDGCCDDCHLIKWQL
jgi:hypothetical protein